MTYTEIEIKEWFNTMKHKYPNSKTLEHLESIEFMMFNKNSNDTLKENKKGLTKTETFAIIKSLKERKTQK